MYGYRFICLKRFAVFFIIFNFYICLTLVCWVFMLVSLVAGGQDYYLKTDDGHLY